MGKVGEVVLTGAQPERVVLIWSGEVQRYPTDDDSKDHRRPRVVRIVAHSLLDHLDLAQMTQTQMTRASSSECVAKVYPLSWMMPPRQIEAVRSGENQSPR